MNCKLCEREAEDNGFCQLHSKAYKNVVEKFSVWQGACEVSWIQYLVEIQKNSLTGEWAKDVAKHIIEEENQNDH
jgi:hypothetical protein